MRAHVAALLIGAALPLAPQEDRTPSDPRHPVRFEAVDVAIDTGEHALAAYQFELSDRTGRIRIVGVEGGEHPAFETPPYYDPEALRKDRIIIAAFSTARDLPRGRTRVAAVHVMIEGGGEPAYGIRLVVAATADGKAIAALLPGCAQPCARTWTTMGPSPAYGGWPAPPAARAPGGDRAGLHGRGTLDHRAPVRPGAARRGPPRHGDADGQALGRGEGDPAAARAHRREGPDQRLHRHGRCHADVPQSLRREDRGGLRLPAAAQRRRERVHHDGRRAADPRDHPRARGGPAHLP